MNQQSMAQTAPGQLEIIREFLNTWRIPNDTRMAVDELEMHEDIRRFLQARFPRVDDAFDGDEVKGLRDDLRQCIQSGNTGRLSYWLQRFPFFVTVTTNHEGNVQLAYQTDQGETSACTALLNIVLTSIQDNQWKRLKVCPDCQWVHYDNTRNGTKVWCGMTKGAPDGRACGTIAKVNRWREKQRGRGIQESP